MSKKLLHGFPETKNMIEKINKDILSMFKDHVEWEKYEKSVVYPFWNNMKKQDTKKDDAEFKKWSNDMKKELMKRGKEPKVTPKVDFDTSGQIVTKNDFSKLAGKTYLESIENGMVTLMECVEGNYDKTLFESTIQSMVEALNQMDKNSNEAKAIASVIQEQLDEWEEYREFNF